MFGEESRHFVQLRRGLEVGPEVNSEGVLVAADPRETVLHLFCLSDSDVGGIRYKALVALSLHLLEDLRADVCVLDGSHFNYNP